MPNWCLNEIIVTGDNKTLNEFVAFVKSDKSDFDFNKIIPYPEEFAKADKAYKELSDEEKMKAKDSFNSGGYEWCIENWGTKWLPDNPYLRKEKETIEIGFDTAWSPSLPITAKLTELFPTLTFIHKYEEPGMDFSGYVKYEGGKIVEQECGDYDAYPISDHEEGWN